MKRLAVLLSGLFLAALCGCPQMAPTDNSGGTDMTGGTGGTGTTDNAGDVSESALSFAGTASGSVSTLSSTTGAATDQAGRRVALRSLGTAAMGWFEDLEGNRLLNANGDEYPEFVVNLDGSFSVANLPVGVDIVLVIDNDGDGEADLRTVINIPQDANGQTGTLDEIPCDPLSTLVAAKIYQLLSDNGIDPTDLDLSISALIGRIRAAYESLFDDSGIEDEITLEDILGLTREQLAQLFDAIIPEGAARGMRMAEGNLNLNTAKDVEGVVKAVARVLLRGGFAIADDPGGFDLSFLGDLPNTQSQTFDAFASEGGDGPAAIGEDGPTIYRSTVSEVDRNFVSAEANRPNGHGPIFSEHVLTRMAELFLANKTISLDDLYHVIVDLDNGLAARFTYQRFNGPGLPPTEVFQNGDGAGAEVNLQQLNQQFRDLGTFNPDRTLFEQRKAQIRALLLQFLSNTAAPEFEQLFAGILLDRVPAIDQLARHIREQRAHVPFSRSGPSKFFVLATADSFQNMNAAPVTVNINFNNDGAPIQVTFDPSGNGKFWLSFGPRTTGGMLVQFLRRDTGRPLHDRFGRPVQLDLADGSVFQAINGQSFLVTFSQSGSHYPGAPALRLPNPGFNPALPPNPQTNPPTFEAFVLVTEPGNNGRPVRVNFASNVATVAESGRYYLLFTERTPAEGLFALITDSGEQLLTTPGDPTTRVLVAAMDIQGATIAPQQFVNFFGVDVPNQNFDPTGAPFYDDINDDDVRQSTEPTFDHRETLFNPADWRSTRIEFYYRRADNNTSPNLMEVNFMSMTPALLNGTPLVARNIKPNLNAFRFGRPAVTIDLLAAFAPPSFFDGTHALDGNTRLNPFTAIALLNLAFDSIHNVEAVVDPDGPMGPQPSRRELINANLFTPPLGDPLQLIVDGFATRATVAPVAP